MKRITLALLFAAFFSSPLHAQKKLERGTIVRMTMAECIAPEHGFMAAMSGSVHNPADGLCPEYVLVADKVVYVIVGKSSGALVPLAETTKFRFEKNALLIRIDDARHEARFGIKEMVLRSEWDHVHPAVMQGMEDSSPHHVKTAAVVNDEPQ